MPLRATIAAMSYSFLISLISTGAIATLAIFIGGLLFSIILDSPEFGSATTMLSIVCLTVVMILCIIYKSNYQEPQYETKKVTIEYKNDNEIYFISDTSGQMFSITIDNLTYSLLEAGDAIELEQKLVYTKDGDIGYEYWYAE